MQTHLVEECNFCHPNRLDRLFRLLDFNKSGNGRQTRAVAYGNLIMGVFDHMEVKVHLSPDHLGFKPLATRQQKNIG
jgi:hypothetical protein